MTQTPEMREAIARIVDPKTAAKIDKIMSGEMDRILPKGWTRIQYARSCYLEEINAANAKADAILGLAPLEGGGEGNLETAMRLLAELAPITGLSSRFGDDELLPDHLRRRPTVATVREAHALLRAHRTAVSTSPPQATNSEVERLGDERIETLSAQIVDAKGWYHWAYTRVGALATVRMTLKALRTALAQQDPIP